MRTFAAALILLLSLPAAAQDMPALFRQGMEAIAEAGRAKDEARRDELLDRAIAAFRKMLIADPRLVRVRLELARAFYLKGEDTLARRHFERVLAGKPPAGVALNVQRFLAEIRARKRWSARAGFALAPDSNMGAGSDDRTIYIEVFGQRLPFTYQGDSPKSGMGIAAWAGGEYQYPLSRSWRLRAGGDVHRKEYREREFDRMTVAAHLGPRWLIGRGTEASLLASVRQHWIADEADHRDIGARTEIRHRLSRRTTAHVTLSRHERRYEERDHLDGPTTDVTLGTGWVASPTLRVDAAIGWGKDKPETERYRHERRWMRLGATVALPWGFTVGATGMLRWTEYEGNWFPFTEDGSPRSDIARNIRVFAHNRAFTVGGFSPQVSLVREDRTSNAQLHDYERTSGELRFVRLF